MTAPKFKIGDVVYLLEPASLGELDAYRIGAIHQKSIGVWIYQIFIDQKPPREQTVGDRIDLKESRNLFYDEGELLDLCEAVDIAIDNIQTRVNRLQLTLDPCSPTASSNPTTIPPSNISGPLYDINTVVFIRASAHIGFLESYKVVMIHSVPNSSEFTYELDLTGTPKDTSIAQLVHPTIRTNRKLYFKERELINKCDAAIAALDALDRKMGRLLGIKVGLCTTEITGSGSN